VPVAEQAPGLAADLGVRAASAALGPADIERTRHSLLDFLGASLAGANEPEVQAVHGLVADGDATVIGAPRGASARDAALVNGIAAHAIEIDDVALWVPGHMGACVCPAALALAETRGRSGRDLLAAIAAGYDVACRAGSAFGQGHSAAGWHVTGTAGSLASAAASARVLGLSEEETANAIALAATQASGLIASFGTTGKSLHTGNAATVGVLSALLAERGATGATDAVEALGLASSTTFDAERPARDIGDRQGISSTIFKWHACSGYVHTVSDAVLWLRHEHGIEVAEVAAIEVATSSAAVAGSRYDTPENGVQAKFSLPHAAAAAFVHDAPRFDDTEAADPEVRELVRRVSVTALEAPGARVTVELTDGRSFARTATLDAPVDDEGLPAQWDRLVAKFERLTVPLIGEAAAADTVERVRSIESTADVRTLAQDLRLPA
jgi:2-methylcitrate dehydratase PrpD